LGQNIGPKMTFSHLGCPRDEGREQFAHETKLIENGFCIPFWCVFNALLVLVGGLW
jgi:hypothetical protein